MADILDKAYLRDQIVDFKDANLSIASAAVLYGLSTYTVFSLSIIDNEIYAFRLKDHYLRLINSAKILALEDFVNNFSFEKFLEIITKTLKANNITKDSLVRVTIFVDGILSGTTMEDLPVGISVFVYFKNGILPQDGANLMVSSFRRTPDLSIPARAKVSGSYVNAALMKNEAIKAGYDDAIALDERGHVTESTVSNIFIVKNNQIISPANSSDLLEGIMRDSIISLAKELNLEVKLREVDRSELYIADEAFLCGTSMDIVPVISIDHRAVGDNKPGEITSKLQKALNSSMQENKTDRGWLTKI